MSAAHAIIGSPRSAPWDVRVRLRATPASTWPSRRRRTGSGIHARHVCASHDARPDQVQPSEERLDVGARMVVPGGWRCTRRPAACRAPRCRSTPADGHATARRHQARVSCGHRPGCIGVEEVQDRAEDDPRRLGRVDDGPKPRVCQDRGRVPQVRRDSGRPELVPLCCPRTFLIPDTFRTGVGPRFAAPTAVRLNFGLRIATWSQCGASCSSGIRPDTGSSSC